MGPDVSPGPLTGGQIRKREAGDPAARRRLRELVGIVLAAVVLAFFVRTFLFQAFVVPSSSMEDTVLIGDHLLVNKFAYASHRYSLWGLLPYREVQRGDIVVFKFPGNPATNRVRIPSPGTDFIKRVVALPGDTVEMRGDRVFVNGRSADRPDQMNGSPLRENEGIAALEPRRVPPGEYFAVGDNRHDSYDSRFWGPVPAENLKGRALVVYWSSGGSTLSAGGPVRQALDRIRHTRWSRTLRLVR